ncbi:MerR family transcriptional regulator [Spirosoma sp.]|uniref:MerR family transcriptional regulator n=1 Tax=Spirosoma sp. TaxID=1899569 RepID=UPI00260EB571|nr:MerR family transcriptional regulator [Spirosoma sp.]MCX6217993.1 MerR family transcriptional regulator [Spirosoma sp.]
MREYSVKKLAKLAGVSVRTLHHYDRLGLLKPSIRTEARYRLYGDKELIRLQQILFYKELDFSLTEIRAVLDGPDFNVLNALESHKQALKSRQKRLETLLVTIDKTILTLKGERVMLTNEELYKGFPKGDVYRKEAIEKYGNQVVEESEEKLRRMGAPDFTKLKADQQEIAQALAAMLHLSPTSEAVQQQIARHYANIRSFWGESVCQSRNMADAYKGLAQLYIDDPRYTIRNGQTNPEYAAFLNKAMVYFAERL